MYTTITLTLFYNQQGCSRLPPLNLSCLLYHAINPYLLNPYRICSATLSADHLLYRFLSLCKFVSLFYANSSTTQPSSAYAAAGPNPPAQISANQNAISCPVYLCFCSLRDSIIFCIWFICPCSVAQVHSNPCCCCSGKSIRLLFISSFVIWPGLEGPSLNEEATRSEFVGFSNTFLWLWLILSCLPSPVSG